MIARHFTLIAVTLVLAVFAASRQLSTGYSINSLYLAPVLLAIWAPNPRSAYWVTAASTVMMVLYSLSTPLVVSIEATLFSRTILVSSFWITAYVIVRYRQNEEMRQREVAARQQAELALRRSDRNLENIRHALDQSALVSTTNAEGDITYVNDKLCDVSKFTRAELIGRNHRLLNSGLHADEFFAELYATISAGQVWRGEIRNRAKDGTLFWVDTTIVPVVDEAGHPIQHIALRYDITERKRSEAALRDQDALARLGKMAAIVAHEVRNPLAGIRGAIQIIGRRLPSGTAEHAIIGEAVARIDTLNGIVEDLLLFARPSKPMLMPVPIADVITNTIALFAQDPKHAEVKVRIEPTDIVLTVDSEQIKLALSNLVLNGAQAMEEKGEIDIVTRRVGSCVEIRVIDQGRGIPDVVVPHLFEPFFTTGTHGTGLGLVTARRILEAHGGTVRLEPGAGRGTVAIVQLPAK